MTSLTICTASILAIYKKKINVISLLTPYTRDATSFFNIAVQKQTNTSRAGMVCGKLTLFLLLQTLKRGLASQDFAEKHSVPAFMFRHIKELKSIPLQQK